MAAYKKYLLVYLDILGFKDLIDASEADAQKVEEIVKTLDIAQERAAFGRKMISDAFPEWACQIQTFSDLIIRATPVTEIEDLVSQMDFELIAMGAIQSKVTCEHGILLRGGIAMGSLYMENNKVFGPAMVRAYHLAEQLAVYPRIVIDEELVPFCKSHREDVKAFRKQGDDGIHFVDYLFGANYFTDDIRAPLHYARLRSIQQHKQVVVNKLGEAGRKGERVKQKAIWMALYHNATIDKFASINPNWGVQLTHLRLSEEEIMRQDPCYNRKTAQ